MNQELKNSTIQETAMAGPGFYLENRKSIILNQDKRVFTLNRLEDRPTYVWTSDDKRIWRIDPNCLK
jgi:hypothetical protein